jgi:hypothetical protein
MSRQKFPYCHDFAGASIMDLITKESHKYDISYPAAAALLLLLLRCCCCCCAAAAAAALLLLLLRCCCAASKVLWSAYYFGIICRIPTPSRGRWEALSKLAPLPLIDI